MKSYLRDLSIWPLAAMFFVCLEHVIIFKTYAPLKEMCAILTPEEVK